MIYPSLDIQITLRCNGSCLNCIEFCGMARLTGLDYSGADVSLEQVQQLKEELQSLSTERGGPVVDVLCITGGEPMLHRELAQIVDLLKPLIGAGVANKLIVNSNLIVRMEELEPYLVNYSTIAEKPLVHNTVLLHPTEIQSTLPTFESCKHYRKWRPVWNVYGYSLCCAGDGYIRLFCLDELIVPRLPESYSGFPLDKMDLVCRHCPFGCDTEVFERDRGCPVSTIYQEQAKLNRAGRKLKSRYGGS
jgi:hypothetical protein